LIRLSGFTRRSSCVACIETIYFFLFMSRLSQHIAKKLIDLLPEDRQYYKIPELREWGFPKYVVNRMQVELERNLAESIVPPKTDWANMQTDAVQNAWNQFITAIRAEARLPASYAHSVVETAIDDIMDILLQPRKNLPDIIFGASDQLSYEEVLDRMDSIVVYRHFATLIPKYMEKKGLDALSREQCSRLIFKADEKLTEHYTPLNWAQMLEPLFNLLDEQIDSNLLRLFFEDKKMPKVARTFDLMNRTLNRAELIEVLSSPELLNIEGAEEKQSELFQIREQKDPQVRKDLEELKKTTEKAAKSQKATESSREPAEEGKTEVEAESRTGEEQTDEVPKKQPKPETGREREEGPEAAEEDSDETGDQEEDDDSILSKFHKGRSRIRPEMSSEEDESIHTVFDIQEQGDAEKDVEVVDTDGRDTESSDGRGEKSEAKRVKRPEPGSETETGTEKDLDSADRDEESASLNEIFSGDQENTIESLDAVGEDPAAELFSPPGKKEEESPMWKRFMSAEELEEAERRQAEEDEEEGDDADTDEEGFIEEPIIDLTKSDEQEPDESDLKRLNELLDDERERFVEEIFRGADEAYDEAVRAIATIDEWKEASKFIDKEVFKRNLVDMYSETAVDFTDRLQTYFIGKNKTQS